MKTLKLVPLFLVVFLFCSYTVVAQEDEEEENAPTVLVAVYLGMEDNQYTFTYKAEDGEKSTISIDKMAEAVKQKFDLTTQTFVGKTFEVTFSTENVADEEDMLTSIRTILALKLL